MTDDPRESLQKQLDLLLSTYREDLSDRVLAEVLFASANGIVALLREIARYDAAEQVVAVPFADAARLEGQLEDLLTTKVICVRVTPDVPMHLNLKIRIVCGKESVEIGGRAVQVTQAGTVFQLDAASVEVQRALVGLPAILRSNPTAALVIDQKSTRPPKFVEPATARDALFGAEQEVAPPAEPAPRVQQQPSRKHMDTPRAPSLQKAEPVVEPPEPSEPSLAETTEAGEDKIAASRLAFQMPKVDGVLARASSKSHFEFLNVHFSADTGVIEEARQELLTLVEQCRNDDLNGTATDRLDALVARLDEAWEVLSKTKPRRAHRREIVPTFQVETAIEMYERQAEAAKMSRRYDVAIDCFRSIVELDPSDDKARLQLEALRALDQ